MTFMAENRQRVGDLPARKVIVQFVPPLKDTSRERNRRISEI